MLKQRRVRTGIIGLLLFNYINKEVELNNIYLNNDTLHTKQNI